MKALRVGWALFLGLTLGSARVYAREEEAGTYRAARRTQWDRNTSDWAKRRFTLEMQLGLATPVGLGGVLDFAVLPELSVACGAGVNLQGPQLACMLRPRILLQRDKALAFGVGASTGPHYQDFRGIPVDGSEQPEVTHYRWRRANWVNVEAGFDWRFAPNVDFRPFVGLAFLTNPGDAEVFEPAPPDAYHKTSHRDRATVLPYLGASLGASF